MRLRAPFALGGLVILALGGLIGFAAFSTDAEPAPTTVVSGRLPADADGRIAAAAFVAMLRGTVTLPPAESAPPPPTTQPPATTTTTSPATTTKPPRATAPAAATTTRPPAPTTTAPPPPPTTTAPPPPSTTAPPPPPTTTTTAPPSTTFPPTGAVDIETWRPLVEEYFPAERVEEALSVIWCESRGNPNVVNDISGAAGLFQFVPNTWGWASAEAGWAGASVFDPEANIASAAWLVQVSIDTNHPGGAWGHWSCQP